MLAMAVGVDNRYTCALDLDGMPACWGRMSSWTTGVPAEPFAALSTGFDHACGLRADGSVGCWGGYQSEAPPTGDTFGQISVGADYTCGVTTEGELRCWGWEGYDNFPP